jgi:hypothetical protein
MTYELKNLSVASLDFEDIRTSLISFFLKQPELADIDFTNNASTANLLINLLATATAYNGIYSQFGYVNSFATTTTLLQSLLGIAANSSVLIAPTEGASTTGTITALGTTLESYTTFQSTTPSGSVSFFFNITPISANSAATTTLYSGSQIVSYTNYDYKTQSCTLPYTVDPRTISFYQTTTNSGIVNTWTRVDKSSRAVSGNQNVFTVINGPQGYIVTNNLPTANTIDTASTVLIKAILSNGSAGNNATISSRPDTQFNTSTKPTGGYDQISVERARYSLLFNATGQDRCVTIADYINAILSSGISGTDDETKITVVSDCCLPGTVNVYVDGLSVNNQSVLLDYLNQRKVAGINLNYKL